MAPSGVTRTFDHSGRNERVSSTYCVHIAGDHGVYPQWSRNAVLWASLTSALATSRYPRSSRPSGTGSAAGEADRSASMVKNQRTGDRPAADSSDCCVSSSASARVWSSQGRSGNSAAWASRARSNDHAIVAVPMPVPRWSGCVHPSRWTLWYSSAWSRGKTVATPTSWSSSHAPMKSRSRSRESAANSSARSSVS